MQKTKSILPILAAILLTLTACGSKETEPLPDTIKWFNTTYAILTTANHGSLDLIGGLNKVSGSEKLVKEMLSEWWDVTDRDSADETIEWLLDEGHRIDFAEDVAYLQEIAGPELGGSDTESLIQEFNPEDQPYVRCIIEAYQAYGDHAIDAWDYCRAMQLLGQYYVAGYYTKEETLDKSLEVAVLLQNTYDSWDDLAQSYLYGYQYWSEDDVNEEGSDSYERKAIYEKLKSSSKNPYTIDWNLHFEKTW